ncbi:hypothetical protein JAAARDRAFT_108506, partial [Jaapia argillacea MUCL 33604]
LSQFPPPLSSSNPILASVIPLPHDTLIAYSSFSSTGLDTSSIELARRQILAKCASDLLGSLLTSVQVARERSTLHVFAFGSTLRTTESHAALNALSFPGLSTSQSSSFTPHDLYPCSTECSVIPIPCPTCLNPSSTPKSSSSVSSSTSAACRLPRHPLRAIYSQFLEAIRNKLINDLSESTKKTPESPPVRRFKSGFLLGPSNRGTYEWGEGWEHHARSRPLIYCSLQLHLSPTQILIHPILRPTDLLPLPFHHPTTPTGTPIALIPYGTPAYYLTSYTGPTSGLVNQFEQSLHGLGVGGWTERCATNQDTGMPSAPSRTPTFVVAWINIQNKQGEDKGMTIIYPTHLCLTFHPSSPSSHARHVLPFVPELPLQLQPSPSTTSPPVFSATAGSRSSDVFPLTSAIPTLPMTAHPRLVHINRVSTATRPRSSSLSLLTFRSLSLSLSTQDARDVRDVAIEAGSYVEDVVRERDRERERIRRERENQQQDAVPDQQLQSPLGISPSRFYGSSTTMASSPALPSTLEERPSSRSSVLSPLHTTAKTDSSDIAAPLPQPKPSPPSSIVVMPPTPVPAPQTTSFDPFSSFDSWTQPTSSASATNGHDFMDFGLGIGFNGMDMGMGMGMDDYNDIGFGMSIDPAGSGTSHIAASANASVGGVGVGRGVAIPSASATARMGMDFEDGFDGFTDDDFSFFDKPSQVAPTIPSTAAVVTAPALLPLSSIPPMISEDLSIGGTGLTPAAGPPPLTSFSPALFGEVSGPGPPSSTPGRMSSSPWVPNTLGEGFTPRFVDHQIQGPPSPAKTPFSHSEPTTPTIHLVHREDNDRPPRIPFVSNVFDPIPFAPAHRIADGKYSMMGKFALAYPSPPPDEPGDVPFDFPSKAGSVQRHDRPHQGLRLKYDAVTDPRISVVKKLIGVKRKSVDQGMRDVKLSPSWAREYEEWDSSSTLVQDDKMEVSKSDNESEDEDELDDDEADINMISRPSTPPPTYLPLGATLLQTHFHHSHLLPHGAPSRPPGTATTPTPISTATGPLSVPTPVSPAAVVGAAQEKSKTLEAAAQMLVKEATENSIWADAWRLNGFGNGCGVNNHPSRLTEVWQADVRMVARLFSRIGLRAPLEMREVFRPDPEPKDDELSVQAIEPPMFTVGKSDAIVQVRPTALQFWEKLGLGPRGGKKDVTAYVLYQEGDEARQKLVQDWLATVSSIYMAKHLGTHKPGKSNSCPVDGLVPIQLETVRKTLGSFVSSLSADRNFVFYVVTPKNIMALASPILRHIFSAVKRVQKNNSGGQLLFHFVAEHIILGAIEDPTRRHVIYEPLVNSVYDRILRPVDRQISRAFSDQTDLLREYFQEPAFAIARPLSFRAKFLREYPAHSLDIVDRHTLLHVGYRLTSCGKWLLAACIDQRGEAHDIGVWLVQSDHKEIDVISQVWSFAQQLARKADVEWRLVVSKLGPLSESELNAWQSFSLGIVPSCQPPIHVSVLSIEQEAPWTFLAPLHISKPPTSPNRNFQKEPPGSVFVDVSSRMYSFSPSTLLPLSVPSSCAVDCSFVSESDDNPSLELVGLLPLHTSILVRVPSGRDYTSIEMLHVHLLHTAKSSFSSLTTTDEDTLAEITHNFHDLAILAQARFPKMATPILPFHLAALEIMHTTLDTG